MFKKKKRKVTFRPVIQGESVPQKTAQRTTKKTVRDEYKKSEDEYQNEIIGAFDIVPNKSKVVFSLCRNGEFGLHHFDIRLHINTISYVGPTKMGVQLPLNLLDEFITQLTKVYDVAEERELFSEYDDEE